MIAVDHFWPGFAFGALITALIAVFFIRALLSSAARIVQRKDNIIQAMHADLSYRRREKLSEIQEKRQAEPIWNADEDPADWWKR